MFCRFDLDYLLFFDAKYRVNKMKKILIIVNTYYQLLVAINIKKQVYSNSVVDIIISDHSNKSEDVYNNLKKSNIFDDVRYIKNRGKIEPSNRLLYIKRDLIPFVFSNTNRFDCYLNGVIYDEVIYYNFGLDIYGIYLILSNKNDKVVFSRMEEGFLSYTEPIDYNFSLRIIDKHRKIIKKQTWDKVQGRFYCFEPKAYKDNLEPYRLESEYLDNDALKEDIRSLFMKVDYNLYSKYKYIYFASAYDSDGISIGEYNLVLSLSKVLGKNNMLIKKHPRDKTDIYEKNGFAIDTNSNIPFEFINLSYDFRDNVFISMMSGSVVNLSMMKLNSVPVYMLYKLMNFETVPHVKELFSGYDEIINYMVEMGGIKNIKILNNAYELDELKGI